MPATYMKTFGAPILQYLFENLVLFLGQENILHGRTALALIQVDTSTIALFLCCTDKDAALLHNYHFILFATLYLALCTQVYAVNGTKENKVSLNSVTYLYTVSCLKPNCVYIFIHHSNSSRE